MNPTAPDVLIVGAGPSGLLLALELCRHGVQARVVDALPGPSPLSRALIVHARTLELLDRHGLAARFVAHGEAVREVAFRRAGRTSSVAPVGRIGEGLSPFPYLLVISQDQTEALLRDALAAHGVQVEWGTALTALENRAGAPVVTLQPAAGPPETWCPAYVAGCDGAGSAVRRALGITFPGGTYKQLFFVADALVDGWEVDAPAARLVQVALGPRSFHAFFPLPRGRTRILGLLPAGLSQETASIDDLRPALEAAEHIRVRDVSWFSTYRVHHRVAERFRQGPVFLVGDAGHVHSPAGGQGMNTGLGDAVNLAWKLAAVLRRAAPAPLLDTYEAERLPFAHLLVRTTDRAFTAATSASAWASFVRTRLVPRLVPLAMRLPWVRQRIFRAVSQTGISYPDSPLSQGHARNVAGGMRLPWAPGRYEALRPAGWQVLCLGPAPAGLADWARARRLPLVETGPTTEETTGTVYLVRPDAYVGLVAATFGEGAFSTYAGRWGLTA